MSVTRIAAAAADTTSPASGLQAVAALRRLTDTLELQQVEAALEAGLGWPEIGQHLGVSRQAVHKKYARRVPPDLIRHRRSPR